MKRLFAGMALALAVNAAAQDRLDVRPGREGPTGQMPSDWRPIALTRSKTPTIYRLEQNGGRVALHAIAASAASAIGLSTRLDVHQFSTVEWDWKPIAPIANADNHIAAREDAALRLVFAFDGNSQHLPISDRLALASAHLIAGADLPYATLMYLWVPHGTVGEHIANPHTGRIEMIVVDASNADGNWHKLKRNILQDYRDVFHEEPGMLTAIGVMTDTDNTGGSVEAWYGDIHFEGAR